MSEWWNGKHLSHRIIKMVESGSTVVTGSIPVSDTKTHHKYLLLTIGVYV